MLTEKALLKTSRPPLGLLQFNTQTPKNVEQLLRNLSGVSPAEQDSHTERTYFSCTAGIQMIQPHKTYNQSRSILIQKSTSKQAIFTTISLVELIENIFENSGTYPNLQFHPLVIPINRFHFEVNSHCANKGWCESVIGVSEEEGCFAHAAVANDQKFEHVIKILIGSIFLPVSGICHWSHLRK